MIKPLDEALKKLVEMKVAYIDQGRYVYSKEFEESAEHLKSKPMGRFAQIRLGRKIHKKVIPAMAQSAIAIDRSLKSFKGKKREIDNIITAYILLLTHCKRLNINLTENDDELAPLIYATYYLNDHSPTKNVIKVIG